MPGGFTRADIEAIATLANLELDPAEVDLFARQLAAILAYADQLRQVDTTDVVPTAHAVARHAAERDDVARPCLDRADALANAPDAAAGLFRVPRVIG